MGTFVLIRPTQTFYERIKHGYVFLESGWSARAGWEILSLGKDHRDGDPVSGRPGRGGRRRGDIGLQLRQTYKNIGAILESAGASYADIVSVVTYVVGTESLQPYQEARVDLFDEMWPDGRFPPNTLLAINGLARPEMLVEVTATAVVP